MHERVATDQTQQWQQRTIASTPQIKSHKISTSYPSSSKTLSFDLTTIMLVNAQSLCNKITELSDRLKSQDIEVLCITETSSAILSTASIPGYEFTQETLLIKMTILLHMVVELVST